MKKDIALKWVEELKSGAYEQGTGALRTNGKFCCLGVLCNLHAQEHPKIAAKQKKSNSYMSESAVLPNEVREWSGMDTALGEGEVRIDGTYYESLANANDNGVTFSRIGDWILKHYKGL